ncbi:flap endonuclease-1 [Candidatus Pacearchaeota archaeon CG10_big_fil_rev_8_21_14_0_10_31_24]|nr:MAG: flap endonuclease-1 [Candidatus Pacearchaeota archaeon CG10_big_fil_rev_8_21_14_0_10_31_24]
MGLQIGDIVSRKQVSFAELKGKVLAVDAFNAIYQFLSSIRQPDGTPLMDSAGKVTSHLSGLFYRNISLLAEGVELIYVFDGEYHELKGKTHEIRRGVKDLAAEKYKEAVDEEDLDSMKKYSRSFVSLDAEKIAESKELLEAMGIAVVQAPGEGEMQCAEIVKSGQAYAVASQDYDALAVGADRLIQNVTLAKTRKTPSGFVYISPEIIDYSKVLNELMIDSDQLISLAILVGTDFNPGGVKGIGPKKALALVREKKYPVQIFRAIEERVDFDWKEVFEIFKKPNVKRENITFPKMNVDKIKEILVDRHEFSLDRVEKQLDKLKGIKKAKLQETLF